MLSEISPEWFAMRVTYGRELKLKDYLDTNHIQCFIPMRHEEKIKAGRRQKIVVPAIRNLIFIHATRPEINTLKKGLEGRLPLRYIMDRSKHVPIVIREKEMQHFIAVSGTMNEQLIYLDYVAPQLKTGKRVRVLDGIFKGVEGTIVRIKRDRRVMVNLDGNWAIATAHIHPSLLAELETDAV